MFDPKLLDQLDKLIGPEPVSEHQLLSQLGDFSCFVKVDSDCKNQPTLALFRKHFLLMHHLYRLQHSNSRRYLHISALEIYWRASPPASNQALSEASDTALRDFYLNSDHFFNTDEDRVFELLGNFWRRYQRLDKCAEALAILGLSADETDADRIAARYRQLAGQHHPDRGGDREKFVEIREAYELLKSR